MRAEQFSSQPNAKTPTQKLHVCVLLHHIQGNVCNWQWEQSQINLHLRLKTHKRIYVPMAKIWGQKSVNVFMSSSAKSIFFPVHLRLKKRKRIYVRKRQITIFSGLSACTSGGLCIWLIFAHKNIDTFTLFWPHQRREAHSQFRDGTIGTPQHPEVFFFLP